MRNCTVTKFRNGFNIEDSTLNVIAHNIATNNRNDGFHILRSEGNIFDDNTAEKNDDDGFDIDGGKANFFRSNVVHENKNKGFNIDSSLANFFIDNTSDENTDRGFRVSHVSRYNPFAGNKACNNKGRFDFEENSHPNFFRGNVFCKEPKEPSPGRIRNSERF